MVDPTDLWQRKREIENESWNEFIKSRFGVSIYNDEDIPMILTSTIQKKKGEKKNERVS